MTAKPESDEERRFFSARAKLLEARKQLKSATLSKHFDLHRGFDAFSVHLLAAGIEPILNDLRVVTEFQVTKWEKSGNTTLVEGRMEFIDVDNGSVVSIKTIGEGVDGSDKGVGKAISNARKQAFIQAFNLAIGVDVEDDDQPARGGDLMQGGSPPRASLYMIERLDGDCVHVAEIDVIPRFIGLLNDLKSVDDLNAFSQRNISLAERLEKEGHFGILGTLNNSLEVRLATLAEANAAAP